METLTVERAIWIAAPRERVWQAITDPVQLGKWWPPDEWKIPSLQVGATIQFGLGDDAAYATIEVADAPRQFVLRWQPHEQFPVTTMMTTFTLEEENGGTRLTVVEAGFESLPDDIRQQRAQQTAEGYASVLADLKAYLERPAP